MNVKQLKAALSEYPDDMNVFLAPRETEFTYGLLNSLGSQDIVFLENPDDEESADTPTETVLILSES
jgi:hypothetical protein